MLDFKPVWESGLQHQREAFAGNSPSAGISMSELPRLGYVMVRGKADGFQGAMTALLGGSLPTEPKGVTRLQDGALALWFSPDEWMIICDIQKKEALIQKLAAVQGVSMQAVDNSGGYTGLRLKGEQTDLLLRHLTPYDVEHLQINQNVGTVMSKSGVVLLRLEENAMVVLVRRSFADYVMRLIVGAARPYGLSFQKETPEFLSSEVSGSLSATHASNAGISSASAVSAPSTLAETSMTANTAATPSASVEAMVSSEAAPAAVSPPAESHNDLFSDPSTR